MTIMRNMITGRYYENKLENKLIMQLENCMEIRQDLNKDNVSTKYEKRLGNWNLKEKYWDSQEDRKLKLTKELRRNILEAKEKVSK